MRKTAVLIGWAIGLAASLWVLHHVGTRELSTPPKPGQWIRWINNVGPAAAIVSILRVMGILIGWYLVLATVIGALIRSAPSGRAVTVVDRVTPRFLRSILASAAGLTATAAGLTVAVTPLLAPGTTPVIATANANAALAAESPAAPGPETAVLAERRDSAPPSQTATLSSFEFELAPFDVGNDATPRVQKDSWVAQPGDHLWHIAEETLSDSWGQAPNDAEIAIYWATLVETNHDRLVDRSNADLIYPGQEFALRPVPNRT